MKAKREAWGRFRAKEEVGGRPGGPVGVKKEGPSKILSPPLKGPYKAHKGPYKALKGLIRFLRGPSRAL